jgi:Tfp pilus assembly protein PilF
LAPDHSDAKKHLKIAKQAARKKKRIEKHLSAGIGFLEQTDYSQAIHSFKDALALDAENIRAKEYLQQAEKQERIAEYLSKGTASFDQEDYSQAIYYCNKVLKLDPDHRDAKEYLEISQLKRMEEKLEEKVDIPTDAQGDAKLPKGW